jgi:acetoin utilization protein AcuB
MSKAEPAIQKYMTMIPYVIQAERPVSEAVELMSRHRIRHLPVMKGDDVFGILTDRDIKMVCGLQGVDVSAIRVGSVCTENPYTVSPDAPVREAAQTMASKHYGSVLVKQNGKLVGIFTAVDACRALADIIQTRFHERG